MGKDDLDDVSTDFSRDRIGELARGLRTERRLDPAHPPAVAREVQDDLGHPGVILEDFLDLLEKLDGALVIEHLPEANDERRRILNRRQGG